MFLKSLKMVFDLNRLVMNTKESVNKLNLQKKSSFSNLDFVMDRFWSKNIQFGSLSSFKSCHSDSSDGMHEKVNNSLNGLCSSCKVYSNSSNFMKSNDRFNQDENCVFWLCNNFKLSMKNLRMLNGWNFERNICLFDMQIKLIEIFQQVSLLFIFR